MSFLNGLGNFFDAAREGSNETYENQCKSKINHYLMFQYALIPAFTITLLFACTRTRRRKLLDFLNGRPGLIFPMDTLTRSSRISYACAFGTTAFLVYEILMEQKFAIEYDGPIALKTLIAIVSMFIYGMVFFPVFACLALGTAFSYALGTLYVWMFFAIDVYRTTECDLNTEGRLILIARSLPGILCLAYLSISIPIRFCIACRKRKFFTASMGEDPYKETVEQIQKSYQGKHVRDLLAPPVVEEPPVGMSNVIKAKVLGILHKVIYKSESGFRYPSRLIAVMIVAGIVVYVITLEFMVQLVTLLDYVMDSLLFQMELVGWDQYPGEDKEVTEYRNSLIVSYYFTNIIKICTIVSIALGCVISFLTILHMMSSFRTNLYAMYRGDYRNIPSPYENSGVTLCIGSIKYAGFQVAYIVWAFIISVLILFILCIILAGLIVLIINGVTDWLVNKLLQVWPSLLITLVLLIVQKLLAKFIFLQDRGQWLRLDNRRFFFIFTYFMFFFNIFMGLVSCLLRILKAIGVGTIFLARLDNSTLPRKFEFFDPGFKAYQGFIHMEAAHTHPVVNVFIRLLMALKNERMKQKSSSTAVDVDKVGVNGVTNHTYDGSLKGASDGEVKVRPVNVAARFNWHVTYTLLYNPAIRVYRKGYMQALMRARKEGLKIPISDKPVTDFDLVKTQEEREKERKEEAERIKMEEKKHHMISTGLSSIALGLGSGLNEESDDGVKSRNTKPDKKHGRITGFFKGKNKKNGGGANGGEHHAMFHMQTRDTTEENPQSPSSSSSSPQVVETSDVDVRC